MANQFAGGVTISEIPEVLDDPLGSIDKNTNNNTCKQHLYGPYNGIEPGEEGQRVTENFDIDNENIPNKQEKISESILDKNAENPATPILKRINEIRGIHLGGKESTKVLPDELGDVKSINISDKDLMQLYDKLGEINPGDDIISKIIDTLDSIGVNKKTSKVLVTILNQISKNNDDRLKESKDGKIERPKEFKGNKLLENDKYKDVVDLLAKNYINFPDGDNGESNFEKDLQLSINTTVNKITYGKSLPKTDGFTYAMNEIKSGDLEVQLEALNYVYSWVNTNEGMKGAKSKKTFNKMRLEHIKNKAEYYDFKIEQVKSQIKDTFNNTDKKRLEGIVEQLEKDKQEDDFKGEVFKAGKPDKGPEGKEEDPFEIT